MNQRDWFDVGVRIIGVVNLSYGISDLVYAGLFYADYFRNPDSSFRFYMIAGWCSIGFGLILIRAGSILVDFAYGSIEEENEADLDESDSAKNDSDISN